MLSFVHNNRQSIMSSVKKKIRNALWYAPISSWPFGQCECSSRHFTLPVHTVCSNISYIMIWGYIECIWNDSCVPFVLFCVFSRLLLQKRFELAAFGCDISHDFDRNTILCLMFITFPPKCSFSRIIWMCMFLFLTPQCRGRTPGQ